MEFEGAGFEPDRLENEAPLVGVLPVRRRPRPRDVGRRRRRRSVLAPVVRVDPAKRLRVRDALEHFGVDVRAARRREGDLHLGPRVDPGKVTAGARVVGRGPRGEGEDESEKS